MLVDDLQQQNIYCELLAKVVCVVLESVIHSPLGLMAQ